MRHVMSPLDFSVEELDQIFNLASTPMPAQERNWQPAFMNRVPVPG